MDNGPRFGTKKPPEKLSSDSSKATKFQDALRHIEKLLTAHDASEELASTWTGAVSQTTHQRMGLKDLHRLLDAGKRVGGAESARGIPMWMVVRTLKASWHADGSWPLLGCDETTTAVNVVRSRHSSNKLLRPKGQTTFVVPQTPLDADLAAGKVIRPDPEPEDVAARYEQRGISVGPKPVGRGFEDW